MVYWNPTTLIYVLSMIVFALQRESYIVATKTVWLPSLNILTILPFTENIW